MLGKPEKHGSVVGAPPGSQTVISLEMDSPSLLPGLALCMRGTNKVTVQLHEKIFFPQVGFFREHI